MYPLRGLKMDSAQGFFRSLLSQATRTRKDCCPEGRLYKNRRAPGPSHQLNSPAFPPSGLCLFLVTFLNDLGTSASVDPGAEIISRPGVHFCTDATMRSML